MLIFFVGMIILIIIVVFIKTINFKNIKETVEKIDEPKLDLDNALCRFSGIIECKTISYDDKSKIDYKEFKKLHQFIEMNYPSIQQKLLKEVVNDHSLIYHWKGENTDLKPILLIAHLDVVPVEQGTENDWRFNPFSGAIADGFVWGRGTMDMKVQLFAILESVESLLTRGFLPKRDIYLAFGQDEEVGGLEGAVKIANLFKERKIEFEYVIDEGGCVTEDTLKEVSSPVAVIGIAEKGYADIEISCKDMGGHSSMPPLNTSVGIISSGIVKLEQNQLKTKMTTPVEEMLKNIGPEMKFFNKLIVANLWLFGPLFKKFFVKTPSGNAMLRTTTAATVVKGSDAPNVLPQNARAVINFRILPGERVEDIISHVRSTVDKSILVKANTVWQPSKISNTTTTGYQLIKNTTQKIYPNAIVTPYLVLGGTDGRKYEIVSDNVYRFSPVKVSSNEIARMHSTNERISIENVKNSIIFFTEIILNS